MMELTTVTQSTPDEKVFSLVQHWETRPELQTLTDSSRTASSSDPTALSTLTSSASLRALVSSTPAARRSASERFTHDSYEL